MEGQDDSVTILQIATKLMEDTGIDRVTAISQAERHLKRYRATLEMRKRGHELMEEIDR